MTERIGNFDIRQLPHDHVYAVVNRQDREDVERFVSARAAREYALDRADLVDVLETLN